MTVYLALDADPGSWSPSTKRRAEIEAQDRETSDYLARRLNLKSWREAHPNDVTGTCECGCGRPVKAPQTVASTRCLRLVALRAERSQKDSRPCVECSTVRPLNRNGLCKACVLRDFRDKLYATRGLVPLKPGYRWGSRVVLAESHVRTNCGKIQYQCRCDCGRHSLIAGSDIRRNSVRACQACSLTEARKQIRERVGAGQGKDGVLRRRMDEVAEELRRRRSQRSPETVARKIEKARIRRKARGLMPGFDACGG